MRGLPIKRSLLRVAEFSTTASLSTGPPRGVRGLRDGGHVDRSTADFLLVRRCSHAFPQFVLVPGPIVGIPSDRFRPGGHRNQRLLDRADDAGALYTAALPGSGLPTDPGRRARREKAPAQNGPAPTSTAGRRSRRDGCRAGGVRGSRRSTSTNRRDAPRTRGSCDVSCGGRPSRTGPRAHRGRGCCDPAAPR